MVVYVKVTLVHEAEGIKAVRILRRTWAPSSERLESRSTRSKRATKSVKQFKPMRPKQSKQQ